MKWALTLGTAALAAIGITNCGVIPTQSPEMRPGTNCLRCHNGERAQSWTVAGTLYADSHANADAGIDGADILITDANGVQLTLHTNGAGNFYTAESLTLPLQVEAQKGGVGVGMAMGVPNGGCNLCHTEPPLNNAPGRIYLP